MLGTRPKANSSRLVVASNEKCGFILVLSDSSAFSYGIRLRTCVRKSYQLLSVIFDRISNSRSFLGFSNETLSLAFFNFYFLAALMGIHFFVVVIIGERSREFV